MEESDCDILEFYLKFYFRKMCWAKCEKFFFSSLENVCETILKGDENWIITK